MSLAKIESAVEAAYGFSGSISRLGGENDNYLIELEDGKKYVFKLAPEGYGRDRILLENAAL